MDVREKLVELFFDAQQTVSVPYGMETEKAKRCVFEQLADLLIANGVTVQEWVSVNDERKPKHGEDVLVVVFDGYDTYTDTDCLMRNGKWCYETENHKVTHWQPMPQPPKGETIYCKDCENLIFSDCYGECVKGYKGIVNPNDTCEHATRKPPKGE